MKIPPGMNEDETLEAIERASKELARTFKFGPHDPDDICQQAALYALEVLEAERYDPRPDADGKPTRPLVNFLYTHCRNRLINFRRDTFRRSDPPCKPCHESLPGRTEHADGQFCAKYESWLKRNVNKQNILCPLDITDHEGGGGAAAPDVGDEVANQELLALIDRELPVELRSAYLKIRDGQKVPKALRDRVEATVREILKGDIDE